MNKLIAYILLTASILALLGALAAFLLLFVPDFNIYWLILSPVILAVYLIPAALLFRLYKKFRNRHLSSTDSPENPGSSD